MRYLNVLGSILFSGVGYEVFFDKYFFGITKIEYFYIFSAISVVLYLATQAIAVMYRAPGKMSDFFFDLFFSLIPLFIVFASYIVGKNHDVLFFDYFRLIYLFVVILDIFVFSVICYKYAKLSNEVGVRD